MYNLIVAVVLALAMETGAVIGAPTLALAAPAGGPSPDGSCDVPAPAVQLMNFPSYADTEAEVCGVYSIEDDAFAMYQDILGYPAGDPRIAEVGLPEVAGMAEEMIEDLADVEPNDPSVMTADDQGAYDWLESVDQTYQVEAAGDALSEYNKWNSEQCTYQPPNTSLFTYNPSDQAACQPGGGFGSLFAGVTPPSYNEFLVYGAYDANQQLGTNNALDTGSDKLVLNDGVSLGVGSAATIIGGAAPQILNELGVGDSQFASFLDAVRPSARLSLPRQQADQKVDNLVQQEARTTAKQAELSAEGAPGDPEFVALDEGDGVDLTDVGMDVGAVETASDLGADALSGVFGISAIALTIGVTEGVTVVTDSEIPAQLQANLSTAQNASAATLVNNLIDDPTGAGYALNLENYENQLVLPPILIGNPKTESCPNCAVDTSIPAPPPGAAEQFHVTALYANGNASNWQWISPAVSNIDTWPLGVDGGDYGPPEETVGVSDGVAWAQTDSGTTTDATADGLSGYLPSGEINYFNRQPIGRERHRIGRLISRPIVAFL